MTHAGLVKCMVMVESGGFGCDWPAPFSAIISSIPTPLFWGFVCFSISISISISMSTGELALELV